ncbi:unnamed protein product [Rotaria sordida]|uniref:Uncharacterized protein n=1 Tax=Rotaria sordida TaxID=392033 RepID=A0A814YBU4_9BILA|nr:unnamed protein product [Rotaria sordida]CAF1227171.1 unnamed protein product [Rotaria sordida]CAF1325574.1 unnamed protein product [Rotaria sordida]CAF3898350.1 unnamed protein product [Rotaria sordida]
MMLSFIRKRFPSKDRSNEHLQNVKSNYIQNEYQDNGNQMNKTESTNDLNVNNNENKKKNKNKNKNKKKNKKRSSLTQDEFSFCSNALPIVNQINKSYSDVDYFPMMPGALSKSINNDNESINRDSLSDCYLNLSESIQTTHHMNYIETSQINSRLFQIPVIDCRQEQQISNYKDVDHQRTKALRQVTEERTQKRIS